MALAGMALTTVGANADLQSPIASALRKMGLPASNPVTDADLAVVPDSQVSELYDRAELRLLENILGNIDLTDIRVGERQESFGQLAAQLEKAVEAKSKQIEMDYGAGLSGPSGLSGGTILLNFQEPGSYDD